VVAHRLGQDEAYFTVREILAEASTAAVREILAEASTAADGVLLREPSDFCRCGFATLGFIQTYSANHSMNGRCYD
jgi:hypothetical protein